jgi:hypothetical protein
MDHWPELFQKVIRAEWAKLAGHISVAKRNSAEKAALALSRQYSPNCGIESSG